jgi:hypothetical protein
VLWGLCPRLDPPKHLIRASIASPILHSLPVGTAPRSSAPILSAPAPDLSRHKERSPARSPALADPAPSNYLTVISGQIEYITMDDKVTVLKQGDILVNASSAHKWRNATDKPCRGCGVGVPPILTNHHGIRG